MPRTPNPDADYTPIDHSIDGLRFAMAKFIEIEIAWMQVEHARHALDLGLQVNDTEQVINRLTLNYQQAARRHREIRTLLTDAPPHLASPSQHFSQGIPMTERRLSQ